MMYTFNKQHGEGYLLLKIIDNKNMVGNNKI